MTINSNPADHQVEHPAPTQQRATQGGTAHVRTASLFSSPSRARQAPRQSPAWSGTDWCLPDNAYVLANRIKAFWAKQGKTVNVELIAAKASKGSNLHHFAIRSDMVGGRPRPGHPMVRP